MQIDEKKFVDNLTTLMQECISRGRVDLQAENETLRTALKDCTDDLEASVAAKYAEVLDYPHLQRKYYRDMEPVRKARELLERK